MKRNTFYKINSRLNRVRDIPIVSRKFRVPKDVLYSIYSQKIVRRTKREYYIVIRQSHSMYEEWQEGKSFLDIAEERMFSPILTTSFILKEKGMTKRSIRDLFEDPDRIDDKRLRNEIAEVVEADLIYSPQGIENQKYRGKFCEEEIQKWLDKNDIPYITEEEARLLEHKKTPDFLLKNDIEVFGKKVTWVESKGSFGSPYQTKHDYKNQLSHYVELFGPGLVSYWLGYVDDIYIGDNILMVNKKFFNGTD